MTEIGVHCSTSADKEGPIVNLAYGVDAHLEPEAIEPINLGISDFKGWNRVDLTTLTDSLLKVAQLEAKEPFAGQGCYDTNYIEGLTQYVSSLKQSTPLEPSIIESVLRHGISPESEAALRIGVADLYTNGNKQVREFISDYLVSGRSAAGEHLPANLKISGELSEALAATIDNLGAHAQARIIKILNDSGQQGSAAVIKAVIHLVHITSEQSVREQAVLFLKDLSDPRIDQVMRACWNAGKGNSRAEGIAITSLLDSHPEELALRKELEEKLRFNNGDNSDFVSVLFKSHVPAAVAMALDQLDRDWSIVHAPFKPVASIVLACQNFLAQDQIERDINRITYHLKSSFSGHSKMEVLESIKTLLVSGRDSAKKFVLHQLESPPNKTRGALVEEAFKAFLA